MIMNVVDVKDNMNIFIMGQTIRKQSAHIVDQATQRSYHQRKLLTSSKERGGQGTGTGDDTRILDA